MESVYPGLAFAAATAVGLAVAVYDLKTLTIPNWLSVGSGVLFLLIVLIGLGPWVALDRFLGAMLVLGVCFAFFAMGVMGGGDAKTAPSFAVLVAPADAGFILMALAVNGLIGLIAIMILRRTPLANGSWKVWDAGRKFPYGVTLGMTISLYTGLLAYIAY